MINLILPLKSWKKVPSILDFETLKDVIKNINTKLDIPVTCYVQKENKIECNKIKSGESETKKILIQLFIKDTANGYNFYTMVGCKDFEKGKLQALPQSSIL